MRENLVDKNIVIRSRIFAHDNSILSSVSESEPESESEDEAIENLVDKSIGKDPRRPYQSFDSRRLQGY